MVHMIHLCPSMSIYVHLHVPSYQICQVSVLQRCHPACCEQWSQLRPSKKQAAASQLYMLKPKAKVPKQNYNKLYIYIIYYRLFIYSFIFFKSNHRKSRQEHVHLMTAVWHSLHLVLRRLSPPLSFSLLPYPASPKPKARRPPSLINVLQR